MHYQIETLHPRDFRLEVPTLFPGVAHYKGLAWTTWNTKAMRLTNEARDDEAKAICHQVDATIVIDMGKRPLGDDRVAIRIAKLQYEREVP